MLLNTTYSYMYLWIFAIFTPQKMYVTYTPWCTHLLSEVKAYTEGKHFQN